MLMGCFFPKDRHLAIAGSAVVVAQPEALCNAVHRCEPLPGVDKCILRAETLGGLIALEVADHCIIYTDCKTFFDKAEHTLQAGLVFPVQWEHADLWEGSIQLAKADHAL